MISPLYINTDDENLKYFIKSIVIHFWYFFNNFTAIYMYAAWPLQRLVDIFNIKQFSLKDARSVSLYPYNRS